MAVRGSGQGRSWIHDECREEAHAVRVHHPRLALRGRHGRSARLSSTPYPTGGTVLFGPVQDEADVATLLARFADLGLSVVEMRPLPD